MIYGFHENLILNYPVCFVELVSDGMSHPRPSSPGSDSFPQHIKAVLELCVLEAAGGTFLCVSLGGRCLLPSVLLGALLFDD